MPDAFTIDISDGIAVIRFDLPGEKVNKLTTGVVAELEQLIGRLESESGIDGAVIVSGKEDNFIAGADISEIETIVSPAEGARLSEQGQGVLERLEQLPFPVVAAINGACLGGGLELALACNYRLATDSPKTVLGLPETSLGIIPGFGGTQRLPRLVGIKEALRMITTGAKVYPKKAWRIGLVNDVAAKERLMEAAGRFISSHGETGKKTKKTSWKSRGLVALLFESNKFGRNFLFDKARQAVRRKVGDHYPAPFAAIDAIEDGFKHGLKEGFASEAHLLGEMAVTDTSKNLIKVFRLRERFSHVEKAPAGYISSVAVIGAGAMGGAIAALVAENGMKVRLVDMSTKALGKALRAVYSTVEKKKNKGIYSSTDAAWIPSRISCDTMMRGLKRTDVVIEAVVESMDVKRSVLADLAAATREDTIIVSNTSSLSISEMAGAVPDAWRVAGMHFFNPVDRMQLVEVVRGEKTSDLTVRIVTALTKRLGKMPIVVKDSPGFLVNRLLLPYLNEAARLLEDGVGVEPVDEAMLEFGMPMGAFILLDVVGLDIASHVCENLQQGFGERMRPSTILAAMRDEGRLGKKSGKGFYRYDKKGKRQSDSGLKKVLLPHVRDNLKLEEQSIIDRLILPMINEAALALEEAVVEGPEAVDAAMIFGAGFPAFTGGLLRYADSLGIPRVVKDLEKLTELHGERFKPSGLLIEMAQNAKSFYSL